MRLGARVFALAILLAGCGASRGGTKWAPAGCRMQGCPAGSFCSKSRGYCESRSCDDGCPKEAHCNRGLNRCEGPPPALRTVDDLPGDPDPGDPDFQ